MIRRIRLILIGLGISQIATGADSTIRTQSTLGVSIERTSSMGFSQKSGTTGQWSILRPFDSGWALGLSTLAGGAKGEAGLEMYRLSAGPILTYSFNRYFEVSLASLWFKEEVTGAGDLSYYASQGRQFYFGWQRCFAITRRASWTLGGYLASHRGNVHLHKLPSNRRALRFSSYNAGLVQGMAMGLRVDL